MSFTGTYHHTIDDKGRLIVPSKVRGALDNDHFVLTEWLDGCIAMWSGAGWARMEKGLMQLGWSDPNARPLVRRIGGSAQEGTVDKQGRITVPEALRGWAGITRECVVIGSFDHAEIWSPPRWEQEQGKSEAGGLEEMAARLGRQGEEG